MEVKGLMQLTTIPKCYKLFFVWKYILLISKLFDLILCDWADVGGNLLFELVSIVVSDDNLLFDF